MSEWRAFRAELRSPKSDVAVLPATFALTVLVDLTVAIEVGMVLAAFLFIKRMAEVTNISAVTRERNDEMGEEEADENAVSRRSVPKGVEVVHRSRKDGTVVLLSDVHMQPLVALTGSATLEEIGGGKPVRQSRRCAQPGSEPGRSGR